MVSNGNDVNTTFVVNIKMYKCYYGDLVIRLCFDDSKFEFEKNQIITTM
jgi:hypothetical protein